MAFGEDRARVQRESPSAKPLGGGRRRVRLAGGVAWIGVERSVGPGGGGPPVSRPRQSRLLEDDTVFVTDGNIFHAAVRLGV